MKSALTNGTIDIAADANWRPYLEAFSAEAAEKFAGNDYILFRYLKRLHKAGQLGADPDTPGGSSLSFPLLDAHGLFVAAYLYDVDEQAHRYEPPASADYPWVVGNLVRAETIVVAQHAKHSALIAARWGFNPTATDFTMAFVATHTSHSSVSLGERLPHDAVVVLCARSNAAGQKWKKEIVGICESKLIACTEVGLPTDATSLIKALEEDPDGNVFDNEMMRELIQNAVDEAKESFHRQQIEAREETPDDEVSRTPSQNSAAHAVLPPTLEQGERGGTDAEEPSSAVGGGEPPAEVTGEFVEETSKAAEPTPPLSPSLLPSLLPSLSPDAALSDTDQLVQCERVIESIVARGFVEAGRELRKIRDDKLYKDEHATFEDYVEKRWGWDRTYANRLINAARVVEGLMLPIGTKFIRPTSEAQVRPLVQLCDVAKQQAAWRQAVEEAHGNVPTAKQVKAAADQLAGGNSSNNTRSRRLALDADAEPVTTTSPLRHGVLLPPSEEKGRVVPSSGSNGEDNPDLVDGCPTLPSIDSKGKPDAIIGGEPSHDGSESNTMPSSGLRVDTDFAQEGECQPATLSSIKPGAERIAAERQRQIKEEGFDASYDQRHTADNMLQMAGCYLDLAVELIGADRTGVGGYGLKEVPDDWIEEEFGPWKPADTPERNLEKGGALVAAALDRLQHLD